MKMLRKTILCLAAMFLASSMLRSQDLSKYRAFTLGSSLSTVLKQTDQKVSDVKTLHDQPALIQEFTWWPPAIHGVAYRSDTVEQILFSFCDGQLYKIVVNYEQSALEGMTGADMVKSIRISTHTLSCSIAGIWR